MVELGGREIQILFKFLSIGANQIEKDIIKITKLLSGAEQSVMDIHAPDLGKEISLWRTPISAIEQSIMDLSAPDLAEEWGAISKKVIGSLDAVEQSAMDLQSADLPSEFDDMSTSMKGGGNALERFARGYKKGVAGMGRFRMELLSTMFAGMALHKVMTGLLQPAAQAAGIFEIWSATLTLMFLPIMLVLLPFFTWLLQVVSDMSPEMKILVGAFVIFLAVVGGLIMFFSQAGLAITGFHTVVAGLKGAFAAVGIGGKVAQTSISSFGNSSKMAGTATLSGLLPVIAVILAIIAVVLILNEAWKNNWGGIRQHVGNFLKWFSGIYDDFIKPVLKFVGNGIIFLANMIEFTMNNIGGIMERIWLQIYASTATVWNWIIAAVETAVNALLLPIKTMWDSIAFVARYLGIEMGNFPTLDLSSWKVELGDVEKRVAELDEQLGKEFGSTLVKTMEQTKDWEDSLNGLTDTIKETGDELIRQGEAIDAGEMEGKGFIPGLEGGIGGLFAPSPPTPLANQAGGDTFNFSPNINVDKAIGDEAITEIVESSVDKSFNQILEDVKSRGSVL